FELRPGRRLPVPPTWGELDGALQALTENPVESPWWRLPSLSASHQIVVWFYVLILVAVANVICAIVRWRRDGATARVVLFAVFAAFGLGLLGQALQRPDSAHLAWGSSVAFSLFAVTVLELMKRFEWPQRWWIGFVTP